MKRKIVIILSVMSLPILASASDFVWQEIGPVADYKINDILISDKEASIYIATTLGVYRSKDKGKKWDWILKAKNVVYLFEDKDALLYAVTQDILYVSNPERTDWIKLYQRKRGDNPLIYLTITEKGHLYLATEKGILFSKDRGRSWRRLFLTLGKIKVIKIIYAPDFKNVYILSENGLFYFNPETGFSERIFIQKVYKEESEELELEEEKTDYKIKDFGIDEKGNLYIVTKNRVIMSENRGRSWQSINDDIINRNIALLYIKNSDLYIVGYEGVFLYKENSWYRKDLGLAVSEIYDFEKDTTGVFYLATDKGLFISDYFSSVNTNIVNSNDDLFKDEPEILDIQKQALAYAGIVEPKDFERHRILARLKAVLPTLKIDYDKTLTYYSNTNFTRFTRGPNDWSISLTWNLSDLIWSEQQRLIDSQARLLIELRNDLLDEVNKLYFERLRIKEELQNLKFTPEKRREKMIKLKELTASLDAITGGYFSSALKEKRY